MSATGSVASRWRASLAFGLCGCLVGLAPACLRPLPPGSVSATTTGSTSTGDPASTGASTATTTTSTGTDTGGGSTSYGHLDPIECDEGKVYICRLDASGECGEESYCQSIDGWSECLLGECSEGCESVCRPGWDCVDAGTSEMLVCERDYEEHCDPWLPDCPAGTKCTVWSDDGLWSSFANKCVPIDPDPVGPGEVCTMEAGYKGVDNCDAHSLCWSSDSKATEGTCTAFCGGGGIEEASCAPGFDCSFSIYPVLFLCTPYCDPLLPNCLDDEICYPFGNTWGCIPDASGDAGFYGEPCEVAGECKSGLYCLPPEYVDGCQAAGCCSPFCDTSEPLACPGATQECIPWYPEGEEPEHFKYVGVCGVPQ